MRPVEIVFNEPLGQFLVKNRQVGREIAQLDEFFLERAIESLVVRIVFGSSHSRIVLLDLEPLASGPEILLKLGAVVMAHSGNLAVEKKIQPQEKILSILRTFVFVHPGVSHFAILVDGGENISFKIVPMNGDGIKTNDIAGFLFSPVELIQLKLGDSFLSSCSLLSFLEFFGLLGIVVQLVGFNHSLDFPSGDFLLVLILIDPGQLLFAVANVLFSQLDDTLLFARSNLSLPDSLRGSGSIFELEKAVKIVLVKLAKPFVKGLSGNPVATGNLRDIFSLMVINDPFEPESGFSREFEDLSDPAPSFVRREQFERLGDEECPSGGVEAVHSEIALGKLTLDFSKIFQNC